ncbi:hypothetical protein D9M68_283660 [compost metagenome]
MQQFWKTIGFISKRNDDGKISLWLRSLAFINRDSFKPVGQPQNKNRIDSDDSKKHKRYDFHFDLKLKT